MSILRFRVDYRHTNRSSIPALDPVTVKRLTIERSMARTDRPPEIRRELSRD
jgi:hypothetical protein